jgi:hypothetical protein
LLVSRDVEQREISERGAAEIRIDTALADGHCCQDIGNLKSPECRHQRAIVGDSIEYPTDDLGGFVAVNPGKRGGAIKY